MLDIEVFLIVKDCDGLPIRLCLSTLVFAVGRDGDRRQVNLLVHIRRLSRGGGHNDYGCV